MRRIRTIDLWVLTEHELLALLQRAASGESPEDIYMEQYVNSKTSDQD